MRNLYEINADIESCVMFDPETGEDLGTDWERLATLQIEREQKLENIAVWCKNLTAEADAIATEIAKLTNRKRALVARVDGIKGFLFEQLNGEHIASGRVKTGFHTTRDVVEIAEGAKIPAEYQRVKTEPDKTALKAAIKGGTVIDGVRLIDKVTVTIK